MTINVVKELIKGGPDFGAIFIFDTLGQANHQQLRHSSKTVYLEFVINQILGKEAGSG